METAKLISDMLSIGIVVLMAVAIACPAAALIAQDIDERLDRLRAGCAQWILGGLTRRLDKASRSRAARGGPTQPDRVTGERAATTRRQPVHAAVYAQPGSSGRPALAPAPAPDRREQKRFKTCFLGTVHRSSGADAENLCDILDISVGGARVRLVDPMLPRRRLTLGLRHFGQFPARVVWRNGEELGLKFEQDPAEIMTAMKGLLPQTALPEARAA